MAAPTAAAADIQLVPADLALPVPLPVASAHLVRSTLRFPEVPHLPHLLAEAAGLRVPEVQTRQAGRFATLIAERPVSA